MKILFAASECTPFAKTGGLADVIGALPKALTKRIKGSGSRDVQAIVVLPKYSSIDKNRFSLERIPGRILVPIGESIEEGFVWRLAAAGRKSDTGPGAVRKTDRSTKNLSVYFIECEKYFDRPGLYQNEDKDFSDNDERFIFFSRAVLELCKFIDFVPDIIHCHDWQTALVPAYLKTVYSTDSFFNRSASVFTIHNIAYQGIFPKETLFLAGFGWHDFVPEKLEYYDQLCFLKAGIVYADKISTVSPNYAKEVQGDFNFGRGMEGILSARKKDFRGILNGLDAEEWNPGKDPSITANYTLKTKDLFMRKKMCKTDLQKFAHFPEKESLPLIGMVSRLDVQKGHQYIAEIMPTLENEGIKLQWVILGLGDKNIESQLSQLESQYPGQFVLHTSFNNELAHKIYAGADIFFMPSQFEPCGLSQLIAMKYGTIPVVTPTGGLADTVFPWNAATGEGTGWVSADVSAESLTDSLRSAVNVYHEPQEWIKTVKNAMSQNFSWEFSAGEYLKLYENAVNMANQ